MRLVKVALGVAALGCVLFVAVGGAATTMPTGGPIEVFVTPSNDGIHGPIVITGAIGDHGQTLSMTKSGKPDANGNYVRITLSKGTFEINATVLDARTAKAQPTIDKATCSYSFHGTGPVTLFNGTGLYTGISGTVNISLTFAGIGPLFTSGAKKGECNMSGNAQPVASYSSISGKGTVRFA